MLKFFIRHANKIKHLHKLTLVLLVIVLAFAVSAAFYLPPVVRIATTKNLQQPPQQVTVTPKPQIAVTPTPKPQPTPQPVAQPVPQTTPAPTSTTTPTVKPAPNSSVPTLQPSTTSTSSTSSSSSTSTTSSSGSSTTSTTSSTSTTSTTSSSTPYTPKNYTSSNWSGYFSDVSGVKYTSVSGAWIANSPTNNSSSAAYDANWIGIGGITSSDLIQVGINNAVSSTGQVSTQAFYETLPSPATTINGFKVLPGDSITASVSESSPNTWVVTISDITQKETFTKNISYDSNLSSAEWIEEDPSGLNGSQLPLDDFGTINFSQTLATANGNSKNLDQLQADNITMVNSAGSPEAVPSIPGSDGASFSVQWKSSQ